MHDALAALLWIAAVTLLLAALAFLVLKWIALRIARRVAESAEQRLAESVQRGLSRSGLESRVEADHQRRAKYLSQIDRLAWLTDRVVPLPVVGGIGIDAVLGVVPVAGDLVSLGISSIVVVRAAQLGVPQELIARLVAIQCTDLALGAVPILGDLVDVAYQANVRSSRLIAQSIGDALRTPTTSNAAAQE